MPEAGKGAKQGSAATGAKATTGRSAKKARRQLARAAQPELKLQIILPGGAKFGPGKVALLEHIDAEGSLSRAAARMKISYRRAWLFMSQINSAFDQAAVSTPENGHGGGPAQLTDFGRELIRKFRELEAEAQRAAADSLAWMRRHEAGSERANS